MIVRIEVRDCLFLNWALPLAAVPPPPAPLRYDTREGTDGTVVFASAVLFRQERVGIDSVPVPWIRTPQAQLQLCTLDPNGVPSVFIRAVLVPSWLAPGARWVARQPARAARMSFPRRIEGESEWQWEVDRGDRLVVHGRLEAPAPGSGPELGSWEETVAFFRRRSACFSVALGSVRRTEIRRARSAVTPVRIDIDDDRLPLRYLTDESLAALPPLHSAWLCSPMTVSYEQSPAERSTVGSRVPAPG